MASAGRLQTDARLIDDLVEDVLNGVIRIPSFQRGLKWHRSDVVRLFDSILRGYPIGNLLLWRRRGPGDERLRIGALEIDARETESALYVVDGQQRLTSLANALTDGGHADPRFALAYDVEREKFVEATDKSPFQIPLPVIFDLSRLLKWFASRPELSMDSRYVERANQVAKSLKDFRVPVYVVEQPDEAVLRDIFDRMNTYGRKLTRAEVFSALNGVTSRDDASESGPRDLAMIAAEVHAATGFGVLDENTVLLAMLARRGPNISRDIRGEFERSSDSDSGDKDFATEPAATARRELVRSMVRATSFLQVEAAVPHFSFLPYRYLVVVLTRYFAHFPNPSPASVRNLRRWFWRAAVLGPQVTKGNITSVTRTLCHRIVPGDEAGSVKALLDVLGSGGEPTTVEVSAFRTNQASTRILLSAMWDLDPRPLGSVPRDLPHAFRLEDLLDSLGEGSSALSIMPMLVDEPGKPNPLRAGPANRIVLPTAEDVVDSPLDALTQLSLRRHNDATAAAVLDSHACGAEASQCLINDDLSGFFAHRDRALKEQLSGFIQRQTEWQFEDTPPLDLFDLDDPHEGDRDDFFDR